METLATVALLGFASYRATQLVVWDSILDNTRKRLEVWRVSKFDSRARKFVWDLLTCTYCTGWWLSMLTALVFLTATDRWSWDLGTLAVNAIFCWAVAGVQALLNRWDDSRPGHNPEGN
ncbi:hypothetical protein SEA_XKCD426_10 [Streptomyces phage Xkcd426]|nr:hypothetical protein SEA_XKCD426_10 [Streptomyces phage Xkcd426]